MFFIIILSALGGAGAFSGDFTTNLARQCRAFSRALKIEKLKAPLFRGPEGAGATNDWCIRLLRPASSFDHMQTGPSLEVLPKRQEKPRIAPLTPGLQSVKLNRHTTEATSYIV